MKFISRMVLGLFLALGSAGVGTASSQAAERVVVVQGRHAHVVRIHQPRQRLGQPLAEPRPILHLAYFPRTYRGVAYVRGPHAQRGTYYKARRHVHVRHVSHVRKPAQVHRFRPAHRHWIRHAASCPVVNRFGIVVAFARGC